MRDIGERIVLTLWVGGLWAIGYLAVPVLFHALDDRQLAGELAGQMFRIINGLGLVCGGLLLVNALLGGGGSRWRVWVIVAMMAAAAVILFVLQPMMTDLKAEAATAGTALAAEFGRLHGASSALYLVASVLGVWLVATGTSSRR